MPSQAVPSRQGANSTSQRSLLREGKGWTPVSPRPSVVKDSTKCVRSRANVAMMQSAEQTLHAASTSSLAVDRLEPYPQLSKSESPPAATATTRRLYTPPQISRAPHSAPAQVESIELQQLPPVIINPRSSNLRGAGRPASLPAPHDLPPRYTESEWPRPFSARARPYGTTTGLTDDHIEALRAFAFDRNQMRYVPPYQRTNRTVNPAFRAPHKPWYALLANRIQERKSRNVENEHEDEDSRTHPWRLGKMSWRVVLKWLLLVVGVVAIVCVIVGMVMHFQSKSKDIQ